jgi:hypothetical protein
MKVSAAQSSDSVTDVLCDVCCCSTWVEGGFQFGEVKADWGAGTANAGQRYEIHLCHPCFFQALANLKRERRVINMFDDNASHQSLYDFGMLKTTDVYPSN